MAATAPPGAVNRPRCARTGAAEQQARGGVPQRRGDPVTVVGGQHPGERPERRRCSGDPGRDAEQGAQRLVEGDGAGSRVPAETSGAVRGPARGRRSYAQRLALPDDRRRGTVGVQPLQGRAQVLRQPGHAVSALQHVGGVRCRGTQDGQHAVGPARTGDGHVQGPEGEGQTGRELRVPAHRLGGVGQHHTDPQPVGVGHRERAVGVQAPPGAEQCTGQSGQDGEPQHAGGGGAQVHPAHMAAVPLHRPGRRVDQRRGQPSGHPVGPPGVVGACAHRPHLVRAPPPRVRHGLRGRHSQNAPPAPGRARGRSARVTVTSPSRGVDPAHGSP